LGSLLLIVLAACAPAVDPIFTEEVELSTSNLTTPASLTALPLPTLTASFTPVPTITPTSTPTNTPVPEITLLFTGQYVPGRCVQQAVEARGGADYIFDEIRQLIQSADLAVGTLNGTLSAISPPTGCTRTFVLAGSPEHADALREAGFDALSVATNHIKNCNFSACGDRAFFETLQNLNRVGIIPIGAGANLAIAMQPQIIKIHGVRFGIVSLGEIEPRAFASESEPGIAVLTAENLQQAIAEARAQADVVIFMPHWGPEYSPRPNPNQLRYAQLAVEAGADLVVGNHTHVVQAIQIIQEVPVFYGLGNFVFDQTWSQETTESVMLRVRFRGQELSSYELIPVYYGREGEVYLADETQSAEILERIANASQSIPGTEE
jgi:poly-gamma-glutamate synthesis protein (capsule biosynthesis protein)